MKEIEMTQALCGTNKNWAGGVWIGKAWSEKLGRDVMVMPRQIGTGRDMQKGARMVSTFSLTSLERALLRLLVTGYSLEEAAPSLGLSLPEAEIVLADLQARCGVASYTRLLVLAVLKAWV